MKKNNGFGAFKAYVMLLMVAFFYSCTPEGSSPVRNKYPEYLSAADGGGFESFQGQDAMAFMQHNKSFATSIINYQFSSGVRSSLVVSLPDISNDSLALKLIETYRPLAMPMITQWARHNSQGLVLDLRAVGTIEIKRSEFIIEQRNSFSIPLVFIYDKNSAQRANEYMSMLSEFPEVQCRKISDN